MERTCSISLDATLICNPLVLTPYHLNSFAIEFLVRFYLDTKHVIIRTMLPISLLMRVT